ncbi:GtrA family protein [Oceanobacillus polygoni]|uniref:Flippase GtrA n=1 Tax=Oceanobacillus polygoni TaxID=1235259 RepID=A0A9X1CKH6_9BACI|nr:GtrA family protein [Oceanobacillus polygoni]MBP2079588.1 putative flippase GtrA [Oceanobacillus polygoni]
MNKEFVRFVFVGIMNTINYYGIYLVLMQILGVHYLSSHIAATIISMYISYFLNIYFTYKVKPSLKTFLMFPLTQVVNIGLQGILLLICVEFWNIPSTYAPIFAVVFTVPVTFFVTRRILH